MEDRLSGFEYYWKNESHYIDGMIVSREEWITRRNKVIVDILKTLSDEERLNIFIQFCIHCGSEDPLCYCTRDE